MINNVSELMDQILINETLPGVEFKITRRQNVYVYLKAISPHARGYEINVFPHSLVASVNNPQGSWKIKKR